MKTAKTLHLSTSYIAKPIKLISISQQIPNSLH